MFVVYINDLIEGINSYMSLFAHDAKLLRRVKNEEDYDEPESDLERVYRWSQTWGLDFTTSKFQIIMIVKIKYRPRKTKNGCSKD